MVTIEEKIKNIEKQKEDLEEQLKISRENERINDLKINGYSKLKDLNICADDYINDSNKNKKLYDNVRYMRQTIFHTKPRFELIYDLFLIQQERINFLEEKIKKLEKT
jgi:hypothetical protein